MADMASNGAFDPIASYARLSERVEGQGRDIVDLRSNMNTGFRNIEGSLKQLSDQLSGNSRTQWPVIWSAIGVSFAVLAAVGALAYRPVLSNQDRLDAALVKLADTSVSQKEMEWRTARGQEDRARNEKAVAELRSEQVPRAEHVRTWASYDQRLADIQRQIDETKNTLGSTYSLRDYISRLTTRLDMLEQRTLEGARPRQSFQP